MVEDVDGNKFLDWVGGVGVLNIGYSQPEIIEGVKEQAERYFHGMFNIVTHEGYVALAEKLAQITPVKGEKKKVFFANSGAEADENAVRSGQGLYGQTQYYCFLRSISWKNFADNDNDFQEQLIQPDWDRWLQVFSGQNFPYYYRNPEGMPKEKELDYYMRSIEDVFEECGAPDTIAAIVVEPLQGEGGFIPAPIEWVKAVREICDKYGHPSDRR